MSGLSALLLTRFACYRFEMIFKKIALVPLIILTLTVIAYAEPSKHGFQIPRSNVHIVQSEKLARAYPIFVRTPRGYDDVANNDKRYPVIYLNDGPYAFQIASGVTHIPEFGSLYEQVILVGISYAVGEHARASRTRDLTPVVSASYKHVVAPGTGGADDYLDFLETQVLPFVETTYRADPKNRTLAGHSFGGLFATWVLLNKPELFQNYVISSPSLWLNKKLMFQMEQSYADGHEDLIATVYFGVGELENAIGRSMVIDQLELVEILRGRNFPSLKIRDHIISDIDHTLAFPINFTRAVRWIFGRQQP
jgi:predicted alpha/beta superfamily hydrolase